MIIPPTKEEMKRFYPIRWILSRRVVFGIKHGLLTMELV